jgi:hypothetical protein
MNPLLLSLLFAIAAISTIVGLSKILPDNLFSKKEPQKATETTTFPKSHQIQLKKFQIHQLQQKKLRKLIFQLLHQI